MSDKNCTVNSHQLFQALHITWNNEIIQYILIVQIIFILQIKKISESRFTKDAEIIMFGISLFYMYFVPKLLKDIDNDNGS